MLHQSLGLPCVLCSVIVAKPVDTVLSLLVHLATCSNDAKDSMLMRIHTGFFGWFSPDLHRTLGVGGVRSHGIVVGHDSRNNQKRNGRITYRASDQLLGRRVFFSEKGDVLGMILLFHAVGFADEHAVSTVLVLNHLGDGAFIGR